MDLLLLNAFRPMSITNHIGPKVDTWPAWGRWLMGIPLDIAVAVVIGLIATWIVRLVVRRVVRTFIHSGRLHARAARAMSTLPGVQIEVTPQAMERRRQRASTIGTVVSSILIVVIAILTVGFILERLGVNVSLLITSLGVAGLGLGLGMQTLWRDLFTGLFMLAEDQYGVGDTIDVGEVVGTVERVTLRVTTIRDAEGVVWYVPNGTIERVGNLARATHGGTGQGDQAGNGQDGKPSGGDQDGGPDANASGD